jgi:hypothetical protein
MPKGIADVLVLVLLEAEVHEFHKGWQVDCTSLAKCCVSGSAILKWRNQSMKLGRSMVLISVLAIGSIGFAQDLATDVGKGANDVRKGLVKARRKQQT